MNHIQKCTPYALFLLIALVFAACTDNPLSTASSGEAAPSAAPADVPPQIAQAAPFAKAFGTVTQTEITSLDAQPAGPNTILNQTSRGVLSGTLAGSFEDDLRVILHPNGTFTAKFTITCMCTVDGKTGVVTIAAQDKGELVSPEVAAFKGRAVIKEGTDDLAHLRGAFEIEGTVDVASGLSKYTYAGQIHLPPQ